MGNSKSNTVRNRDAYVPLKPALKKTVVPGPVNGPSYYPAPYGPGQYVYPGYPPPYPVVPNENYLQNQFYPQPQTKQVSGIMSRINYIATNL